MTRHEVDEELTLDYLGRYIGFWMEMERRKWGGDAAKATARL